LIKQIAKRTYQKKVKIAQ